MPKPERPQIVIDDPWLESHEEAIAGRLHQPGGDFIALMEACDLAFNATGGLFDPTVQALWAAMATETEQGSREDWSAVRFSAEVIELAPRQTLTFNGIAQGFATDRVTEVLERHGLVNALVNIGEYRALGGPWRLGVSDPHHGLLGMRSLSGRRAIATSSARATLVGGRSHILHHTRAPIWSTVSVEADTATLADSLKDLSLIVAREPREEALAIALILPKEIWPSR